jgi:hypothetical protein
MQDKTLESSDAARGASLRDEFGGMVDELLKNNTSLRRRGPLVRAFEELAFGEKTSDSVKFRALDKISDFMDKAEQHENNGDIAKNIRTFVQLLKRYFELHPEAAGDGEPDDGLCGCPAAGDTGTA